MRDAYSFRVTEPTNTPADSRNSRNGRDLRSARGRGRDSRGVIDAARGAVVVEFGMPLAEHDKGRHKRFIEPLLTPIFARHRDVHHIKIDGGNGRRLGELFNVKLWPTLIFLYDGKEIMRLTHPHNVDDIEEAFAAVVKHRSTAKPH